MAKKQTKKEKQASMRSRMAKLVANLWDRAAKEKYEGFSYTDIGNVQEVKFEDGKMKVTIKKFENDNLFVLELAPIAWYKHKGTTN